MWGCVGVASGGRRSVYGIRFNESCMTCLMNGTTGLICGSSFDLYKYKMLMKSILLLR
jgi:hypothetical protein